MKRKIVQFFIICVSLFYFGYAKQIFRTMPPLDSNITLKSAIEKNPQTTIFYHLIQSIGALNDLDNREASFTLFIPKDSSWPRGLEKCLVNHPILLKNWLFHHILPFRWAPNLPYHGLLQTYSINGAPVDLSYNGSQARINNIEIELGVKRFGNGNLFLIKNPMDVNQLGLCGKKI